MMTNWGCASAWPNMYCTKVKIKAFIIEAMRKKTDKKSSLSPAILLKLYVLIILYVIPMLKSMVYVACLKPFVNQKKVPSPLGKHPKSILAMKMCSVTIAVPNCSL